MRRRPGYCRNGHRRTKANTYIHPNGTRRQCRDCMRNNEARIGHICQKCAQGIPHEFTHGTIGGYKYHLCRCVQCRRAMNYAERERYWANRERKLETTRRSTVKNREAIRERRRAERNAPHVLAQKHRAKEKCNRVPVTRSGPWTNAERAIVLRDDISLLEMCYLLGRSWDSVTSMRWSLTHREARREAARQRHHRMYVHKGHRNSRKSECIRGHPFTAENTYIQPGNGARQCRECMRMRDRRRRPSRRTAAA